MIEIKVHELHSHNTLHQIHVSSPYRLPKHSLAISCCMKCKCVEIKLQIKFQELRAPLPHHQVGNELNEWEHGKTV